MTSPAYEFTLDRLAPGLPQSFGEPPCRLWLAYVITSSVADGDFHLSYFGHIVEQLSAKKKTSVDHVMDLYM
jgi:hypothetical protein